jgi:hypothetical protein
MPHSRRMESGLFEYLAPRLMNYMLIYPTLSHPILIHQSQIDKVVSRAMLSMQANHPEGKIETPQLPLTLKKSWLAPMHPHIPQGGY